MSEVKDVCTFTQFTYAHGSAEVKIRFFDSRMTTDATVKMGQVVYVFELNNFNDGVWGCRKRCWYFSLFVQFNMMIQMICMYVYNWNRGWSWLETKLNVPSCGVPGQAMFKPRHDGLQTPARRDLVRFGWR